MTDNGLESASILVVDDEAALRYSVSKTLQRVGYSVREASNGEDALDIIRGEMFDVVLTDIRMPPGLDGVELVRRIKDTDPDTVVILMTAYPSLNTAVEALRLGAHDYLIKPSSSVDIRASVQRGIERARSLKRRRALLDLIRSNVAELSRAAEETVVTVREGVMVEEHQLVPDGMGEIPLGSVMTLGPLTIYPGRYEISVEEHRIDLTPTEFDLLLYLAAHRGRVVSCHELVREVRGYAVDEAEAREVIRPHVSNLRRKLKAAGQDEDLIVNVRGIGYRLSEQVD
ncbi:MAG: response regulator transcription factor [Chloroflexi bacterium]|jgi:DNA-binding response OmpR family regulator|uniref:response regulator transcription factor n=1 Tax=Candidatus Flexifilum breve TaxID=3140694 RepID=UPI00313474F6|nr:response regulator transcription factor [Chloroflexota bacterium]